MNSLIQMLILALLALLGITRLQGSKNKDLRQKVKQAEDHVSQKTREMEKLDEVQKEIKAIEAKGAPEKIKAPESGDVDSRLDRLNRLHKHSSPSSP